MAKKKFYAVAKGRNPGIFTAWFGPAGAEAQVRAFKGAVYKGFETIEAARAFMEARAGDTAPARPPRKKRTPAPEPPDPPGDHVRIYTDGGALGNPGPGGYGVVIIDGGERTELSVGFRHTTNNRMELSACIAALEFLDRPAKVVLYSDSKYVVDGITKGWARRWQKNGWMRTQTDPAVNPDLWERLLTLCERHTVAFRWVKGHAGHPENERCDQLAVAAAKGADLRVDRGYERRDA